MSLAQQLAFHLPYLRRYARALCGSQKAGDSYVGNVLEIILNDTSLVDDKLPIKIALFKVFSKLWNSVEVNLQDSQAESFEKFDRSLNSLTPLPRQAFLLTTVEGFTVEDVSLILEIAVSEVRTLIETAGVEMSSLVATDVLIIEDETMIAMDLEALVESLGHHVVAIARTHSEAISAVQEHAPGLILADIQLADGSSGLDAVNELLQTFNVPVIFITAYPERLLTGERPEPAFLLTKPYNPAMLSAIISQALFFDQKALIKKSVA